MNSLVHFILVSIFAFMIGLGLVALSKNKKFRKQIDNQPVAFECIFIVIGALVVSVFGIYGSGYNAADFVYAQF